MEMSLIAPSNFIFMLENESFLQGEFCREILIVFCVVSRCKSSVCCFVLTWCLPYPLKYWSRRIET